MLGTDGSVLHFGSTEKHFELRASKLLLLCRIGINCGNKRLNICVFRNHRVAGGTNVAHQNLGCVYVKKSTDDEIKNSVRQGSGSLTKERVSLEIAVCSRI